MLATASQIVLGMLRPRSDLDMVSLLPLGLDSTIIIFESCLAELRSLCLISDLIEACDKGTPRVILLIHGKCTTAG